MTKATRDLVPNPRRSSEQSDSSLNNQVWLRITAFLSLKSSNTLRTYSSVIKEWCKFIGAEIGSSSGAKRMLQATELEAIAYKTWLERQIGQKPRINSSSSSRHLQLKTKSARTKRDGAQSTLANATIAKKFTALRRIYRLLIAADLGVRKNPFDIDLVPVSSAKSGQKRPTEMLDFKKVKKLLALPDANTSKGLRDRVILSLLFGAGLRRSELVSLRIGDIRKTSAGTMYLRLRSTKAGKDQDQAMPSWVARDLELLLKQRNLDKALPGDPVLISYRGKGGSYPCNLALSDSGLYKLFRAYCLKAGYVEFLTPHSARATAITKLLSDGVPHREVQEFSRHASIQMVELYDKRRIGIDENPARDLDYE